MATQAQIQSILTLSKAFEVQNLTLEIVDISNYTGALTLAAPYRIYGIFQILDPLGTVVYINSGYVLNDFSNPDIDPNASVTGKTITLTTDINGAVVQGNYTINYKVQVIENFGTTNLPTNECLLTEQSLLKLDCYPTKTVGEPYFNCNTAIIKDTDVTKYGNYQTLIRTHYLFPPVSLQLPEQHSAAQVMVYNAGTPYTGTWAWQIDSGVVYVTAPNTTITITITGTGEFKVECNTKFCFVLCVIRRFATAAFKKGTIGNAEDLYERYNLAMSEFVRAYHGSLFCNDSTSTTDAIIENIFRILDVDPTCGCEGCGGETPTPILPTTIINGQDGTDGTNGISPSLQVNAGYLQVSYDMGATWLNLINLALYVGQDGTTLIDNTIADLTSVTTSLETLKQTSIPANALQTNGDMIRLNYVAYANVVSFESAALSVEFGSVVSTNTVVGDTSHDAVELTVDIIKVNATTAKVLVRVTPTNYVATSPAIFIKSNESFTYQTVTGLDWTVAQPLRLLCTATYAGLVVLKTWTVTKFKI